MGKLGNWKEVKDSWRQDPRLRKRLKHCKGSVCTSGRERKGANKLASPRRCGPCAPEPRGRGGGTRFKKENLTKTKRLCPCRVSATRCHLEPVVVRTPGSQRTVPSGGEVGGERGMLLGQIFVCPGSSRSRGGAARALPGTLAPGRPRLRAEVRDSQAAGARRAREGPRSRHLQGPGRPARLGSSRPPDDTKSLSRATLDCSLLRVPRSGAADLLDSWRAGRSSPYRFALMIFLKERDSCEQTGLTGTAPPPQHTHPQGISFCLRLTSKSVIGPVRGVTRRISAVC